MSREKPAYRDQPESIVSAYPHKECLCVRDVAHYCGKTEKTVAKHFPFVGKGLGRFITRTSLARELVNADDRT